MSLLERITLHNIAEVEKTPAGWQFYRLPLSLLPQLNENAQHRARWSSGSEFRFNLQGEKARLTLHIVEEPALVEVYQGNLFQGWHVIQTEPTTIEISRSVRLKEFPQFVQQHDFGFDAKLFRVLLPWKGQVVLHDIEGDISPAYQYQTPAQTYLAYGSSITHGNATIHPTGTYPARLAQHLDVNLINLGLGAGAYFEPEMADYIAQRKDWDFATIEMGINMVDWCAPILFEERISHFLTTLTTAYPQKQLFCFDLFPFFQDYGNDDSFQNQKFREIVQRVVTSIDSEYVKYFEAQQLLQIPHGLSADVLHPSPAGMEEISRQLALAFCWNSLGSGTSPR